MRFVVPCEKFVGGRSGTRSAMATVAAAAVVALSRELEAGADARCVEELLEEFDKLGEYVRSMDYMMPMCACGLKDMMHKSFQNVSSYDGKEMLATYLMNLELVCEIAMKVEETATELRALDVAHYLAELCGKVNKAAWMVKATLRCG